jgi:hypothetical protein
VKLLLAVLFAASAAVQYNDPDPLPWLVIYGVAAVSSAWSAFGRPPFALLLAVAAVAFVWALLLVPGVMNEAAFTGTEEERECAGLLLVCGAMLALYRRDREVAWSRPTA